MVVQEPCEETLGRKTRCSTACRCSERSGDWTVHLTLDQTARGPLVALVGLGGWW